MTTSLLFTVTTADAKKPLDVDCDLLASTVVAVDAFLDANNVEFDNLGDLVASAILDDAVFDLLEALILFFSGGQIDFDSASQAVSTIATCGLMPLLIGEIGDGASPTGGGAASLHR